MKNLQEVRDLLTETPREKSMAKEALLALMAGWCAMRKLLCWIGKHVWMYGSNVCGGIEFEARKCNHCSKIEYADYEEWGA